MTNPFITQADPMGQVMVDPEAQALQRQKQYAAMLLQNNQQPQGQMIGNRYVGPSWTQQLNAALNPVVGAYMMNKADTEQAKLAEAIRQQGEKDIQTYAEKVTGKPAVQGGIYGPDGKITTQTTADMYGPNMELNPQYKEVAPQAAVEPDFLGGLAVLRASRDPENRALAKMLMAERLKSHVLPEGGTIVYGGLGGEGGKITGAPKKTEIERDYERAKAEGYTGSFVDYDLMRRNASANRTNVNVQNALPFKEEIQKGQATTLVKNYETLQGIPATLANMDKMVNLSKSPIYMGSGADTKLGINKFLNNNLGLNIAPDKVKNSEEFQSAAFMGIMDNLKKLDSTPTQAQQATLKEALGNLGTDPSALPKVVQVYKDVLINKAKAHNESVNQVIKNTPGGNPFLYDIRINIPTTPEVPNPNPGGWRLKNG